MSCCHMYCLKVPAHLTVDTNASKLVGNVRECSQCVNEIVSAQLVLWNGPTCWLIWQPAWALPGPFDPMTDHIVSNVHVSCSWHWFLCVGHCRTQTLLSLYSSVATRCGIPRSHSMLRTKIISFLVWHAPMNSVSVDNQATVFRSWVLYAIVPPASCTHVVMSLGSLPSLSWSILQLNLAYL